MFIKKDVRKIPQILLDASQRASSPPSIEDSTDVANPPTKKSKTTTDDIVTEMRLGRRAPEFLPSCSASILLEPKFRPALDNLVQLSLYDCGLSSLAGIEQHLSTNDDGDDIISKPIFPKLQQLDIGRNPKLANDSLPSSFHTQFPSLLELWCDDCSFGPEIPKTLLQLDMVHVVRMTMNKLEGQLEENIGIKYWNHVCILAMDGNKLTSVGKGLGKLKYLEKLHLRQNMLTSLPEGVPSASNTSLEMLCLSSNQLTSLPKSIVDVENTLTELYVNKNKLETVPENLADKLTFLKKFNLAHNEIDNEDLLPKDFVARFGLPEAVSGQCIGDSKCVVMMEGNPIAERRRKAYLEEEKAKAKALEMEAAALEEMEVDDEEDNDN